MSTLKQLPIFIGLLLLFACNRHLQADHPFRHGDDFDVRERFKWDSAMLADPATGKIPDHIRAKELGVL